MRVALVHDWLNQKDGGGESVLKSLAEIYPDAPIYTLIYNPELFNFSKRRIRTSRLQSMPHWLKTRSRYLLPLVPTAIEDWDFSEFDLVISSSCAFTKNIITSAATHHISYCHSPMRFAWDYWPQYLSEQNVGPVRRAYIRQQVSKLRQWDYIGAARVDSFIANSRTTQARISKYYRRDSTVIYPPVITPPYQQTKKADYFVTMGALTPYKKIDLVIEAFNISGLPLKIIGDGPSRFELSKLAADNIEFMGFVSEKKKQALLSKARGLIYPNLEDFGISAVEAMAAGTPVVGYRAGGVAETVIDGKTGILFDKQTPAALNAAVLKLSQTTFNPADLTARANQFSTAQFQASLKAIVQKSLSK